MGNKKTELLTQTELVFMQLIWSLGETTVRAVRSKLEEPEQVPYTTVAAVIRLLASKGFLNARKEGKALLYSPAVTKDDYECKAVSQIVDKLFNGEAVDLATRLIDSEDLTLEEMETIREELARKIRQAQQQ